MLTPLFPPDTSDSAGYSKLLAKRLNELPLSLLAYGKLPESIPNVLVTSIDKSGPKIFTVVRCVMALHKTKPSTLFLNNGPSTDLPALLYKLVHPALRLIYIESDRKAAIRTGSVFVHFVNVQLKKRSVYNVVLPKESRIFLPTDILPFESVNPDTEAMKNEWWNEHTKLLKSYVR